MNRARLRNRPAGVRRRFRVEAIRWMARLDHESRLGRISAPERSELPKTRVSPHNRPKNIVGRLVAQATRSILDATAVAKWEDDGGA